MPVSHEAILSDHTKVSVSKQEASLPSSSTIPDDAAVNPLVIVTDARTDGLGALDRPSRRARGHGQLRLRLQAVGLWWHELVDEVVPVVGAVRQLSGASTPAGSSCSAFSARIGPMADVRGVQIHDVAWNLAGDHILVATGTSIPKLYDRDAHEVCVRIGRSRMLD